ncbi:hypothetical protein COLU111180_02225 [Cohnella lubricantis]|uniref:Uncharacterized protein n=1 Tax=Cohnella lubricantis TaxID=2163172 RepID=A0A841TJ93_9BACL|nr:hypothetical protein [Cohnella lubricantis]MBB6678997.1 hypothetical protein [Cohnella lubricantis]MBP2119516.1 hypothetical protein [Cohnella lubricantis]
MNNIDWEEASLRVGLFVYAGRALIDSADQNRVNHNKAILMNPNTNR